MRTKRALVCAPVMPEFDRESGSRRIYHLITLLREIGWSVTFYAENMTGGERYARILRQQGVMVFGGVHSRDIASDTYLPNPKDLLKTGHFDVVLIAFWYLAESLLPLVRTYAPTARVIIDSIDVHFLRMARKTFNQDPPKPSKVLLNMEYASETIRELNAYATADAVFTVSQKEADLLNDFMGRSEKAFAVPDMEELPLSPIPFEQRNGFLFVGNFRHKPNVEAVRYLFEQIVPRLDPALFDTHPLYIVGNALDPALVALGSQCPGARMVGWVPSVHPYFERTRVSIVPLTYGAGTKRKIIESLSLGTPCVSTRIGVEGLDLQHDREVLIADGPSAFAEAIASLLENEHRWLALQEKGRSHIVSRHGKVVVRQHLAEALGQVMAKTPQTQAPSLSWPRLSHALGGRVSRAKTHVKRVLRFVSRSLRR